MTFSTSKNWETHQLNINYREQPLYQWRAPRLHRCWHNFLPQADYKDTEGTQILSFGVSSQITLVWLL